MDKNTLLLVILKSFPGRDISQIDVKREDNAIRFTWKNLSFRVTTDLLVEETVGRSGLLSTTSSELVQQLLKYNSPKQKG